MSAKTLTADIAVIGAGSAGLSVAAGAAMLGLKVVLFEKGEMGGDCLNTGCVPSKALIKAGKLAHAMRHADAYGVRGVAPVVDWPAVKGHVKGVIETIAPIDSQERFEGLGVTVIREEAKFLDAKTIGSASAKVRARRIVIATGSKAAVPPIPGLSDVPFHTHETIFDLDVLPRRLIVLGGGPIGAELGQAFRRLGAEVVIVEAARFLSRMDPEAAVVVRGSLEADGVEIVEGGKATRVERRGDGVGVETTDAAGRTRMIEGSHLLVALGRSTNFDSLDLAAGQVALDGKAVAVSPTLRTSNPRVWIVGDAAGMGAFTHLAGWHASAFVRSALFKAKTRADSVAIPEVTYTSPEVGQIGLTEARAIETFGAGKVKAVKVAFHDNDRAQTERETEGFAKLVTDTKGKILGATIVGEGAGDLLQMIGLAIGNKLGVRALTNFVAPYPTRGEIIKRLGSAWYTPIVFGKRTRTLVGLLQRLP